MVQIRTHLVRALAVENKHSVFLTCGLRTKCQVDLAEISIYKEMNVGAVKKKEDTFLQDDFSVMKIWYNGKGNILLCMESHRVS